MGYNPGTCPFLHWVKNRPTAVGYRWLAKYSLRKDWSVVWTDWLLLVYGGKSVSASALFFFCVRFLPESQQKKTCILEKGCYTLEKALAFSVLTITKKIFLWDQGVRGLPNLYRKYEAHTLLTSVCVFVFLIFINVLTKGWKKWMKSFFFLLYVGRKTE